MGHIITVSEDWRASECDYLLDSLKERGFSDVLLVKDPEMEAFEYDELEEVTVNEEDITDELDIEDTEDVKFLNSESLNDGME